jgi:predicted transcriptional regulator
MDREDRQFVLDFCSEVRDWRKDLGLSQAELARLIDVSPSWVSMMEHGDILPAYPKRQRVRLVLEDLEFKRVAKRLRQMGMAEDLSTNPKNSIERERD